MPTFPTDPRAVTVLAPQLADALAVLDALAPLGTGDVFCAAAPDDGLDDPSVFDGFADDLADEPYPYYSATYSDTVATFVVEVERSAAAAQTRYEVRVAESGPGADRLRYRVAKAVVAATGGVAVNAQGDPIELGAGPDDPFGSLW